MKKQGIKPRVQIPEISERCEYCIHNLGENKKIGYMWYCSHLSPFCVVFGLTYCRAKKEGKGKFELDKEKYEKWKLSNTAK